MVQIINDFLEYLKSIRNYSEYTIINYNDDLKKYSDYLERECLNYKKIEYSDIRGYLIYLKDVHH